MKVLNIYRSQPEDRYRQLAEQVALDQEAQEVRLYASDKVDYDQLLQDILATTRSAPGGRGFGAGGRGGGLPAAVQPAPFG